MTILKIERVHWHFHDICSSCYMYRFASCWLIKIWRYRHTLPTVVTKQRVPGDQSITSPTASGCVTAYHGLQCKPIAKIMRMAKVRPPGAQKPLNGFRINMEFITTSGYDHTCKSTWRWENAGGLGEQVTCHMFRLILSILFFLFYFILAIAHSP